MVSAACYCLSASGHHASISAYQVVFLILCGFSLRTEISLSNAETMISINPSDSFSYGGLQNAHKNQLSGKIVV